MFAFRLSCSRKPVHRDYSTQLQEAFREGHIDAFREIDGVPALHIRYDNLTAAVKPHALRVQPTTRRERPLGAVPLPLRVRHVLLPAGIDSAHEKRGAEGEAGRIRRAWLSPMPKVESLAELNAMVRR